MLKKVPVVLIALGLFTLVAFQNCGSGGGSVPVMSEGNIIYVEKSASEAQQLASGYETQCSSYSSQSSSFPLQAANSSLSVTGSTALRASSINSIQGMGNAVLFGTTASSKVTSFSSFQGNLVLCNMSLGTAGSGFGNIVVQGGAIDSISGFTGTIIILGGSTYPAAITNYTGNLVVKTNSGQYMARSYIQR